MSKAMKLKNNTYLDSTGIVHERKLLSELLNNSSEYISVGITSSQSTSQNTFVKINFNKIYATSNNLFTLLDNGKVQVNEDCTIEINANIRFGFNEASTKLVKVYVNNNQLIELSQQNATATTLSASSIIISVSKNDTIHIEGNSGNAANFNQASTYLTIKKIL